MANNIKDAEPHGSAFLHSYAAEVGPDPEMAAQALGAVEWIDRSSASVYSAASSTNKRTRTSREAHTATRLTNVAVREMMAASNDAYYDPGLGFVRNVIDMMSSFAAQGIRILHPNRKKQQFYTAWANQVQMPIVTERFLNYLYRLGNNAVQRQVAKLSQKQIEQMMKTVATYKPNAEFKKLIKPSKNELPIEYTFLNPASLDTVDGELAAFLGKQVYILRIPNSLLLSIKTPKTPSQKELVAMLPAWVRDPIQNGQKYVLLDNDMISVHHYMKDDWMQWAVPMIHSILSDLTLYNTMKRADGAALDGVISGVRLWNVGSLEHKIQPGPGAIMALQDILMSASETGGPRDLVWDDTLRLHETTTNTHQFLGAAKYAETLRAIYAGLGIPQSLTGSSSQGAGFTNNAISIKTLIERLSYGRTIANRFWKAELEIVRQAIGDKQEPMLVYDNMNLYDEAAEKMLWVQLYDRFLVSDETVQENFGMIPEVEARRIARENAARDKGSKPAKAGPFFESQPEHQMTKIALTQGLLAPSEAGVEKKPRAKGDMSLVENQNKQADKQLKAQQELDAKKADLQAQQSQEVHEQRLQHKDAEHKAMLPLKKQAMKKKLSAPQTKGQPGQGRPSGTKDQTKRKQRRVLPRTSASELVQMTAWARTAQKVIAESVTPIMLERFDKKNVRSLSGDQVAELEQTKLSVLWATEPYTKVDAAHVTGVLARPLPLSDEIANLAASLIVEAGIPQTAENLREMQISAYSILKGESDGEDDSDD
jgi:hypothetical protein